VNAKEIKALRKTLGMTQKDFAKAVGCKISSIEHYEQGVRSPAKQFAERLDKMAKKAKP
jgi:transcriptional regulator with XRE-family HTH domain